MRACLFVVGLRRREERRAVLKMAAFILHFPKSLEDTITDFVTMRLMISKRDNSVT